MGSMNLNRPDSTENSKRKRNIREIYSFSGEATLSIFLPLLNRDQLVKEKFARLEAFIREWKLDFGRDYCTGKQKGNHSNCLPLKTWPKLCYLVKALLSLIQ